MDEVISSLSSKRTARENAIRILMLIPFYFVLRPLILRNYRLRKQSRLNFDGKHLDEWYWADTLAVNSGWYVR